MVSAVSVFSDGFESNDFSAWTNTGQGGTGTAPAITSTAHHGTYASSQYGGNTAGSYSYVSKLLGSSYTTLYVRVVAQVSALPEAGDYVTIGYTSDAAWNVALTGCKIYNDGGTYKWALEHYKDSGTIYSYSSGFTPATNEFYTIEWMVTISGTVGAVQLYVNGTSVVADSGFDNNGFGDAQLIVLTSGCEGGDLAVTTIYDCAVAGTAYIGLEVEPTLPDAWDTDLNNYFCAAILLIFAFVFMIFMVSRRRY